MGILRSLLIACAIWLVPVAVAAQQDRVAFVVGNSLYERNASGEPAGGSSFNLLTPERDAKAYVERLGHLGWDVVNASRITNLSNGGILQMLFEGQPYVNKGAEVLFVFNGHGFSENNENHLLGVAGTGETFKSLPDLLSNSITVSDIVDRISAYEPSRIILIINACTDEPPLSIMKPEAVRQSFEDKADEVLIFYSSSQSGVAYDVMGAFEREDESTLSVFTRSFLKFMGQDQPLLQTLMETRIEVEALTRQARLDDIEGVRQLQIPHVLYDTIKGDFSLASAGQSLPPIPSGNDWRANPAMCRVNEDALSEAVSLRDTLSWSGDQEENAALDCILEAALQDMGIEKYALGDGQIRVTKATSGGKFEEKDEVQRIYVFDNNRTKTEFFVTDLALFDQVISDNYFRQGWRMVFYRKRGTKWANIRSNF